MVNLFFDTEFTNLDDPNAELISIGIVDETGFAEFYSELEHDKDKASYFVEDTVYPLLLGIAKPASEVRANLLAWLVKLRRGDEELKLCCDYIDDIRFMQWLLGEKPDWIKIIDIAPIVQSSFSFFYGKPKGDESNRHNALHDAHVLRSNYLNAIGGIE